VRANTDTRVVDGHIWSGQTVHQKSPKIRKCNQYRIRYVAAPVPSKRKVHKRRFTVFAVCRTA
jgi:hypothetical protein